MGSMNSSKNKLNSSKNKLNSKISYPNRHLISICLRSTYFAETENFFVKSTVDKCKS